MGRRPCLDDVSNLRSPSAPPLCLSLCSPSIQDSYRLPDGFVRVGYDADTQSYIYQDSRGVSWEGGPGERYGSLRPTFNYSCARLSPITQRAGETTTHRPTAARRPSPSRPIDARHPPSRPIVRPTPQRHQSHQIVWVPPTYGGLNCSEKRPADGGKYDKSVSRCHPRRGFLVCCAHPQTFTALADQLLLQTRVFGGSDLEEKSSWETREAAENIPLRRGRVSATMIESVWSPRIN
jgi:hypothetical protein